MPGEMKSADAGPASIVSHNAPENAAEQSEDRIFMGKLIPRVSTLIKQTSGHAPNFGEKHGKSPLAVISEDESVRIFDSQSQTQDRKAGNIFAGSKCPA